jgi:hypothetical protein
MFIDNEIKVSDSLEQELPAVITRIAHITRAIPRALSRRSPDPAS